MVDQVPEPPIILVDDDGWMDVFPSVEYAEDHLEWPFIDEVVAAFDVLARKLSVTAEAGRVRVAVADVRPSLEELQEFVDAFFSRWTEDSPPRRSSQVDLYLRELGTAYRDARVRRRKRKNADGRGE